MITTQIKDPDARLDYGLDWSPWLRQTDGTVDSLVSASWAITGPDTTLIIDDEFLDTTITGIWLEGGTAGCEYLATCSVVTAAGRQDDRSIKFRIRQR